MVYKNTERLLQFRGVNADGYFRTSPRIYGLMTIKSHYVRFTLRPPDYHFTIAGNNSLSSDAFAISPFF